MKLSVVIAMLLVSCSAETVRSQKALRDFKVQTGYPNGRPGHVVDHVIPLCACHHDPKCLAVLDKPENMQWQEHTEARKKDKRELATCRAVPQESQASLRK